MPNPEALQAVFRYAADTLGERVLDGRRLVWKPGLLDNLKTGLNVAKAMVTQEHDALQQSGVVGSVVGLIAPVATAPSGSRAPAPPPSSPPPPRPDARSPVPPPRPARPTGLRSPGPPSSPPPPRPASPAWAAAKPSVTRLPGAPVLAMHREQHPLWKDAGRAALKMGGATGVIDLVNEGAWGGADMALKPEWALGSLKFDLGAQHEPSEVAKLAIPKIVEMIRGTGVIDGAIIDMGHEIAKEMASCLPIIGAVLTLSEAAAQTINGILDKYRAHRLRKNEVHITPGAPRDALQATRMLYNRHAEEMAARATTNWIAGGLQAGGLMADMGVASGPLVGIIKSVINLVLTIANTCLVLGEMRAGNQILMNRGPYNVALLQACPILGTYLLTEAESSTLYAFLVAGTLPPKWMDEVERLKPNMEEVIRAANSLQRASPFMLAGGTSIGSYAKGDHFLDTRIWKTQQRFMHEAKLVVRRDPKAYRFLEKHMDITVAANLPGANKAPTVASASRWASTLPKKT